MKKHRNFIIFYSLWLAGIFGIFVAFGENTPEEEEYLKTDIKICTAKDDLKHKATKAFDNNECNHKEL